MIIIPFKAWHIDEMVDLGAQQWIKPFFADGRAKDYETSGYSMTGTVNGEIIGCAGIYMIHQYRGIVWAILDVSARRHMMKIHLALLNWLRTEGKAVPRIDAIVDPTFGNAVKWMDLLGFKQEGPVKEFYFADGRAAVEYVRINK